MDGTRGGFELDVTQYNSICDESARPGFWEGHDCSRVNSRAKLKSALAPEGHDVRRWRSLSQNPNSDWSVESQVSKTARPGAPGFATSPKSGSTQALFSSRRFCPCLGRPEPPKFRSASKGPFPPSLAGHPPGAALHEAEEKRDAAWHVYNVMCVN